MTSKFIRRETVNNTYNSTDFWYTFINSLHNEGLSYGRGELVMDEDKQEQLLVYLKEKLEEGVMKGETALPPGLHNYFWRFTEEILPKIQTLAEDILKSDQDNSAASMIVTLVKRADWESQRPSILNMNMKEISNDPCMNLAMLDEYRQTHFFYEEIEREENVLNILERLYTWGEQQDDTARYQEARSFYFQHGVTPYAVYRNLKDNLDSFKNFIEDSSNSEAINTENERYKSQIAKCRELVAREKAAFRKNVEQNKDDENLVDSTSVKINIWEAYLKSLEIREHAPSIFTQNDQEHLLEFLKAKIEEGIVDGKTTLPEKLNEHFLDFPEAMHLELREFSEEVLETHPENGAAMKMLTFIVWGGKNVRFGESDRDLILLEQAMNLAPNDTETCFFALRQYDEYYDPFCILTLTALERLFARSLQQNDSELYQWLTRIYKEIGRTPCHIFRNLMNNPDANAELIERCKPLMEQMLQVFQQRLSEEPEDWYALRGIGDIYETLGETELKQQFPWKPHAENKWVQEAWVGKQLPDFKATAIDGTPINLSDYEGKMLVLNWCAKWCGFCEPEIPHLKNVYDEYHDKGLEVIGISLDEKEAELQEFTKEHEIPWLQIYDGKGWKSEFAQFFGINSVPSQWFIDRDGKIISIGTRGEDLSQLVKWTEVSRIGNEIPDFTAVDVDGNTIASTTLQGNVTLFHFGYIHDEPELEHIGSLYKKYHENGFEVIGVNLGGWRDEEALRGVVGRNEFQGNFIYADHDGDQAALSEHFGFGRGTGSRKVKFPAFILIDTNGKVIDARAGKVHSPEIWATRLEKLIIDNL